VILPGGQRGRVDAIGEAERPASDFGHRLASRSPINRSLFVSDGKSYIDESRGCRSHTPQISSRWQPGGTMPWALVGVDE